MTENICLSPRLGTNRNVRKSESAALAWQLFRLLFNLFSVCPSLSINPYLPTANKHYTGSKVQILEDLKQMLDNEELMGSEGKSKSKGLGEH